MALFDFLDLEGNTMAGSAGSAAPSVMSQYQQGVKDSQESAMALAKLQEIDQKMMNDALEYKQKQELLPLSKLAAMQKINVRPAELNDEDIAAAKQELFGDAQPTPADIEKIKLKAMELASARNPVYDPNDMATWVRDVSRPGMVMSDLEADITKATSQNAARLSQEMIKQQGALEKQQAMFDQQSKEADKRIAAMFKIAGAQIKSREGMQQQRLDEKERVRLVNEVKADANALDAMSTAYGAVEKLPKAMKSLYEKAIKTGDAEALDVAKKVYDKHRDRIIRGAPEKKVEGFKWPLGEEISYGSGKNIGRGAVPKQEMKAIVPQDQFVTDKKTGKIYRVLIIDGKKKYKPVQP